MLSIINLPTYQFQHLRDTQDSIEEPNADNNLQGAIPNHEQQISGIGDVADIRRNKVVDLSDQILLLLIFFFILDGASRRGGN